MARRRGYWLVWCAMLGALYLFENNTATRSLLISSALLPVIDAMMVRIAARRLRISLKIAESAEKKSELPLAISIACSVPMVRFRTELQGENRLTGQRVQLTSWARRTNARQAVQDCLFRAEHCGMVELRMKLRVCGFLGLWEREAAEERRALWVPPALQMVQIEMGEAVPQEEDAADEGRFRHGSGEPFAIREYVPGDSVRRIHWKLSEKMDTLMLREEQATPWEQLLLAVDLSGAADAAMISEETEMLFSISHALLEKGIAHDVLWQPAQAMQPEIRRIETQEDQLAFETDYFSITPHRSIPLAPGEMVQPYARVMWIGSAAPQALEDRLGQRITPIANWAALRERRIL